MKILILTSRFGSGYGMGYSAFKESIALADAGNIITVVHCNADTDAYCDPRVTLVHLPTKKIPLLDFIYFFFSLRNLLSRKINLEDFDVIYIQSLEFGLMNIGKVKKPVFYFARSTMVGLRRVLEQEGETLSVVKKINHHILVFLEKRCMSHSRLVFVKSHNMVKEVGEYYDIDQKKIVVVTGGIDRKDFPVSTPSSSTVLKKKYLLPIDHRIVLYAGRVVPQKGLLYLVKAALQLLLTMNFIVVIAGSQDNESYAKKVHELLKGSVYYNSFHFLNHINQLEMSSIFGLADCLVTPSLYEPFGMVNLQAAFLGKTIITTNIVGSVDLLYNYSHIHLIEPSSATAIEIALKKTLSVTEIEDSTRFNFDAYSWKIVAQQLLKCFTKNSVCR